VTVPPPTRPLAPDRLIDDLYFRSDGNVVDAPPSSPIRSELGDRLASDMATRW